MELVLTIGLQAAGKSSFCRAHLTTHTHVSKDRYPRSARRKAARQAREIEAALGAGRDVVVDNTHPTRAERAPLIAQARRHQARVVGYYLRSVLADCLARNAQREGPARVPDVALFATCSRLELPRWDEGYDALFYVEPHPEQTFRISPWQEEP